MQNLRFLLLLVLTLPISAQHTSLNIKDYNEDGVDDKLKCTYEIGSNFGGSNCELIDGKTKTKFTLSNYGCYCAIKLQVYVTPELRKKENERFLYTLKKEILPEFKPIPDQSLHWIIRSGLHTEKIEDHPYINTAFNPQTNWRHGEPEAPYTYSIEIKASVLSKLVSETNSNSNEKRATDHKDILVYYGGNHFTDQNTTTKEFKLVQKNDTYEILKTAHGVVAKKGNTYKWLFVTDIDINDSPQKLRWESIEKIVLQDNIVLIKQSLAPDAKFAVYAIDIESGVGGSLKIDFDYLLNNGIAVTDLSKEERFSVQNNELVIGKKRHKLKFPLTEIKQTLVYIAKGK